jgi:hypothetical protein
MQIQAQTQIQFKNANQKMVSCDAINALQDYILTETNIDNFLKDRVFFNNKTPKNNAIQYKEKNGNGIGNETFFLPYQNDSLFWCFYIIKNGDVKYELLGKITPIIEKKLKIEYVEKIRHEKQLIKQYKLSCLSKIENQLANESKIDLKTLLTLCVLENINIMYINKRTYYELTMNDSNKVFVVKLIKHDKFGYKLLTNNDAELNNYRDTLFRINNIDKPTKSISSYTIKELVECCGKLAIETTNSDTGKLKTKKELYESFIQHF